MSGSEDRAGPIPAVASGAGQSTAKRDVWLSVGAFIVFVLASVALITAFNPPKPRPPKEAYAAGQQPLDLTLVHTNDTWGYLDPCG